MKKAVLLLALASFVFSAAPSYAGNTPAAGGAGDGKVKTAAKKIGAGIMWGPKKIGAGMKKMGEGAKKLVGKG